MRQMDVHDPAGLHKLQVFFRLRFDSKIDRRLLSPASSIAFLYLVKRITAKKTLFFWHQTKTGEKMCLGWTDSWKDVVSCLTESHGKLTSRHQRAFSARRVSAFQLRLCKTCNNSSLKSPQGAVHAAMAGKVRDAINPQSSSPRRDRIGVAGSEVFDPGSPGSVALSNC